MRALAALLLSPILCVVCLHAADPTPEPDEGDARRILGTWQVVKAVKGGTPAPEKEVSGMKMKITRDTLTIVTGGKRPEEAVKYTLDPKAKPRAIDIQISRGKAGSEAVKGIYKIDKDQLTISFDGPGKERPKKFDEKSGAVLVLKKEKATK